MGSGLGAPPKATRPAKDNEEAKLVLIEVWFASPVITSPVITSPVFASPVFASPVLMDID